MRRNLLTFVILTCIVACAQSTPSNESTIDPASTSAIAAKTGNAEAGAPDIQVVDQVVDIACGECQFGMEGTNCDLAVRVDGQPYFVDGFSIDDFGDAHAADGLCNAIKQARVTGRIEGERFIADTMDVVDDVADEPG